MKDHQELLEKAGKEEVKKAEKEANEKMRKRIVPGVARDPGDMEIDDTEENSREEEEEEEGVSEKHTISLPSNKPKTTKQRKKE